MSDSATDETYETVEKGKCPHCGPQEGPFNWRYGPRCPDCDSVLTSAWETEEVAADAISSDTTANDLLDDLQ